LNDAQDAIRQADVLIDVREADEFAAGICPELCWNSGSAAHQPCRVVI
jgi:rhodanese-related sulfurtransferase